MDNSIPTHLFSQIPPSLLLKEKELSVEFGRNYWCQSKYHHFLSNVAQTHLSKVIPQLCQDNQLNTTEKRPVTHVAWRDIHQTFSFLHQQKIKEAHQKIFTFAEKIEKEKN